MKTDRQALLEVRWGKPIEVLLRDALAKFQGEPHQVPLAGLEYGLAAATLYNWCRDLGIDIDEYRGQEVSA